VKRSRRFLGARIPWPSPAGQANPFRLRGQVVGYSKPLEQPTTCRHGVGRRAQVFSGFIGIPLGALSGRRESSPRSWWRLRRTRHGSTREGAEWAIARFGWGDLCFQARHLHSAHAPPNPCRSVMESEYPPLGCRSGSAGSGHGASSGPVMITTFTSPRIPGPYPTCLV
jgi:hypothetical protein